MKVQTLHFKIFIGVLIIGITILSNQLSQAQFDASSNGTAATEVSSETNINSDLTAISDTRSVYETGTMSLPTTTVKSFIIVIPDEAHHPREDDKMMSPKNPNFLPTTLEAMDGTEVSFVHGDPSHTNVEIVRDRDGSVAWETIPVEHPGGSDTKALRSSGSPYSISDKSLQT
jgi:hypothetical protein